MAFRTAPGDVEDVLFFVLFDHLRRRMAAVAGVGDEGRFVADGAGDLTLAAAVQWEGVIGQGGRALGEGVVAARAVQTEQTGVDDRLGMPANAVRGRAFEGVDDRPVRRRLHVTVRTGQIGVRAVQDEDGAVVETGHTVHTVMAFQAGRTELRGVHSHKLRITGRVALFADGLLEGQEAVDVAGSAVEQFAGETRFMPGKAEVRPGEMVERRTVQHRRRPALRCVAVFAGRLEEAGMDGRLGMAGCAFDLEAGGLPGDPGNQ